MLSEEFKELMKPADGTLTTEQRLAECYKVLHRVAYGSNTMGNIPLAGGVEAFAKLFLARHGVCKELPMPPAFCPHCGQPVPCGNGTTEDAVP